MTETPAVRTPSTQPHPITKARAPLEATGALIVLGASIFEAGVVINILDSTEGGGDFFDAIGFLQLYVFPLVLIGLLVAISPRLFFRWDQKVRSGMTGAATFLAIALGALSTVFTGGSFVTQLSRASDDAYDTGASEWLIMLGATVASLATVVLGYTAFRVLLTTVDRPTVEPLD